MRPIAITCQKMDYNNETSVKNRRGGGFLLDLVPLTQQVLLGQGVGFVRRDCW